jgi:hypothetical protein
MSIKLRLKEENIARHVRIKTKQNILCQYDDDDYVVVCGEERNLYTIQSMFTCNLSR